MVHWRCWFPILILLTVTNPDLFCILCIIPTGHMSVYSSQLHILVICKIPHKAQINNYLQGELVEKVVYTDRLLIKKRRSFFHVTVNKRVMEVVYFWEALGTCHWVYRDVEQAVQLNPSQMCPSMDESTWQPDIKELKSPSQHCYFCFSMHMYLMACVHFKSSNFLILSRKNTF